jgi:hypothetical protein
MLQSQGDDKNAPRWTIIMPFYDWLHKTAAKAQ